jgi:enoyl-CoA hydratase/carnithine racemase
VVITGSGRGFATGGDLKELLGHYDTDNLLGLHNFTDNSPFNTLRACPKTVIAAVNGFCLAGGLIVASYCDIVIAAESATLGIPQARHGLADKFIPACLFGRVPLAKLKYLVHTAKLISAREALECGMVTEVVPDDQLAARVDEVIAEVQSTNPAARAEFKRYLDRLQPFVEPGIPEGLLSNPDLVEGLRRFADRSHAGDNGAR